MCTNGADFKETLLSPINCPDKHNRLLLEAFPDKMQWSDVSCDDPRWFTDMRFGTGQTQSPRKMIEEYKDCCGSNPSKIRCFDRSAQCSSFSCPHCMPSSSDRRHSNCLKFVFYSANFCTKNDDLIDDVGCRGQSYTYLLSLKKKSWNEVTCDLVNNTKYKNEETVFQSLKGVGQHCCGGIAKVRCMSGDAEASTDDTADQLKAATAHLASPALALMLVNICFLCFLF